MIFFVLTYTKSFANGENKWGDSFCVQCVWLTFVMETKLLKVVAMDMVATDLLSIYGIIVMETSIYYRNIHYAQYKLSLIKC